MSPAQGRPSSAQPPCRLRGSNWDPSRAGCAVRRAGSRPPSQGTPTATSVNANSVPMLTRSASSVSGTNVAITATTTPVRIVVRSGVPNRD